MTHPRWLVGRLRCPDPVIARILTTISSTKNTLFHARIQSGLRETLAFTAVIV